MTIWPRSGGITSDDRRLLQTQEQTQEQAYRSLDVVRFLRMLRRQIASTLLVIWDGAPIHRGQPIQDCLRRGAASRWHLERLPGSAPALTPDAGSSTWLTRVELGTRCRGERAAVARAVRRAKERLRHQRTAIHAGVRQAGYRVEPSVHG
jgi:hypothetical protein